MNLPRVKYAFKKSASISTFYLSSSQVLESL